MFTPSQPHPWLMKNGSSSTRRDETATTSIPNDHTTADNTIDRSSCQHNQCLILPTVHNLVWNGCNILCCDSEIKILLKNKHR